MFVGDNAHAWAQRPLTGHELADGGAVPAYGAVGGEDDLPVWNFRELRGAARNLAGKGFLRRVLQSFCFRPAR